MASALKIHIATAAHARCRELKRTGVWEGITSSSYCHLGSSTAFGISLSLQKTFREQESSIAAVGSSSKFNISSELRIDGKTGDGAAPTSSTATSEISVPIPKGSDVDEEDLEGLSTQERFEAVEDAKLAMNSGREMLAQPMDLENRGKEQNHPYAHLHVGERWQEIQGQNHWDGLLDPLDPVLRGEVMRYGEFAQAAYDAFDYDTHSRYCGSAKYNKKRLLEKVGLANRGYEVTDYLYVTSSGINHPVASFLKVIDVDDSDDFDADELWDRESNWMGFVAVANDEEEIARLGRRDIVIVWRGTVTKLEWLANLRDYLAPSAFDYEKGIGSTDIKVEAGFLELYVSKNPESPFTNKSAREQVQAAVKRLVEKYKDDELSLTVTGHSLGSALAHICAYDFAENSYNCKQQNPSFRHHYVPITVFSFAGPRVGNDAYRDRMEELGVKVLRVVNKHDRVPKVPGLFLNEHLDILEEKVGFLWDWIDRLPWTYTHCGVALQIDNLDSPYLRKSKDILSTHNLEAYIHLINGHHGKDKDFQPVLDRDIALVNKKSNFLRPKLFIPTDWWQEENKGLTRTKEGRWVPRFRDPEDVPQYEHDYKDSVDLAANGIDLS